MKLLVLNFRKRKKRAAARNPFNYERLLFKCFLAIFVVLLGVQAALLNPAIRSAVTVRNDLEGTPLGQEEYLYLEGSMELQLIGEETNPFLKVLVNGDEVACFEENTISIPVVDGDVIELDGSAIGSPVQVAVSSVSSNLDGNYKGRTYTIDGGIKRIARVRIVKG